MKMIVAHAKNRAIGKGNTLPWRLSEDMQFFKRMTLQHGNLLVGKKTLMSIPNQSLPDRKLHILSTTHKAKDGEVVLKDIDEALEINKETPLMVIGGEQIYKAFLPHTCVLYVTKIDLDVAGADTFFPTYEGEFEYDHLVESGVSKNGLSYSIERWIRKA